MISMYSAPDFLTANDVPTHRVRCPVHGFIRFSENERRIIDHPLFQRLRFVRQLGLTEYLYPGATHTRFEHSLGVMEVATRMFDTLATRSGGLLQRTVEEVPEFKDAPLKKARQVVRLAALLHDVGHASFSHGAENVVNNGAGHEALGLTMLRDLDLGAAVDETYWSGCRTSVAGVIEGKEKIAPQLRVLHDLISGQVDADRADYLLRDSLHCGVTYGHYDLHRLVDCVSVVENDAGGLDLALHRDGLQSFEALILARYQMNTQVYYHRVRRIYDHYLIQYHKALGPEEFDSPGKVLEWNDVTLMGRVMADAANGSAASPWARRIVGRHHHRMVFETPASADAMDVRRVTKMEKTIRQAHPSFDIVADYGEPVSIHKLLRPGDEDEGALVRLELVDHRGRNMVLGSASAVLRHIPRSIRYCRLFADATGDARRQLEQTAATAWRDEGGA